jgi:hypothetical protein
MTDRVGRGAPVRTIAGSYAGAFTGQLGEIIDLRLRTVGDRFIDDEIAAVVRITFWGRPVDLELDYSHVERAESPQSK